jgi:hypothetical protein
MRVVESFPDSAKRAYKAGLHLSSKGDFDSAGHLFGVSAECAAKAALERAGIKIDNQTGFRLHFPRLREEILRSGLTRHMIALVKALSGPPKALDGYSIDTRYCANGSIDRVVCGRWQTDAEKLLSAAGYIV